MRPAGVVVGLGRSVLRGYARLGRGVGGVVLVLAAVSGATAAVVLPLWLLATRQPAVFTGLSVAVIGAALLLLLLTGVRKQARLEGGARAWVSARLLPALARLGGVICVLGGAYGLLLLLVAGRVLLAIPAAAALAVVIGLWAHRGRARGSEEGPPIADDRGDGPSL